jgi:hypothetical protein
VAPWSSVSSAPTCINKVVLMLFVRKCCCACIISEFVFHILLVNYEDEARLDGSFL